MIGEKPISDAAVTLTPVQWPGVMELNAEVAIVEGSQWIQSKGNWPLHEI